MELTRSASGLAREIQPPLGRGVGGIDREGSLVLPHGVRVAFEPVVSVAHQQPSAESRAGHDRLAPAPDRPGVVAVVEVGLAAVEDRIG